MMRILICCLLASVTASSKSGLRSGASYIDPEIVVAPLSHKEGNALFIPKMVPAGSIQPLDGEELAEEEELGENVIPKMVMAGDIERMYEEDPEREEVTIKMDEEIMQACEVVEHTKDLASFLYSLEPFNQEDGSSKKHVMNLVKVVCPALITRFPEATADLDCHAVSQTIFDAYDSKYVGLIPLTLPTQLGSPTATGDVIKRNIAMGQLLHSSRTFFGWDECKKYAPSPLNSKTDITSINAEISDLTQQVHDAIAHADEA